MKRLLQINVTANQGSHGRIAENIGAAAMARGWESYIAYGRGGDVHSASTLLRVSSTLDSYLHAAATRLADAHGLASAVATRRLVRAIKEINPDIVHLHNIHGYYLNYPVLFRALKERGCPVVWTLHDCWPLTGHCAHFDAAGCDRWKSHCHNCPESKSYPRSFVDASRRNFDIKRRCFTSIENQLTLVSVSDWLADIVGQSFLQHCRIHRIYNGIDTEVFHPVKIADCNGLANVDSHRIVLGVASVWTPRKGLDDMLALSNILPADYRLVIVGLSRSQLCRLPASVEGIGRVEDIERLAGLYSAASVFVNPTYEEAFGLTNVEAMACGTPVVTYNSGGCSEVVTPAVGRVVEKGDVVGLLRAIEDIACDDNRVLCGNCREYAVEHFDSRRCSADYLDLYESLLS